MHPLWSEAEKILLIGFCCLTALRAFFSPSLRHISFWTMLVTFGLTFASQLLYVNTLTHHEKIWQEFIKIGFYGFAFLNTALLHPKERTMEIALLLMGNILCASIIVTSDHLMTILVALWVFNISVAYLMALSDKERKNIFLSLKWFFLSSSTATFFLFACALLLQNTKTLSLPELHALLIQSTIPTTSMFYIFLLCFIFISLLSGITPFIKIFPNLVEESSSMIASHLVYITRWTGLVLLIKIFSLFHRSIPGIGPKDTTIFLDWLMVISALTLLGSSLGAFLQNKLKRMLGYVITFQSGFALLGLIMLSEEGFKTLWCQMIIESLALPLLFSALSLFKYLQTIKDFKGFMKCHFLEGFALMISLMALIGLPPMSPFLYRIFFMAGVYQKGYVLLAIVSTVSYCFIIGTVMKFMLVLLQHHPLSLTNPVEYREYGHLVRILTILLLFILISFIFLPSGLYSVTPYYHLF